MFSKGIEELRKEAERQMGPRYLKGAAKRAALVAGAAASVGFALGELY